MANNLSVLITILGISAFTFIFLNKSLKPALGSKDFNLWIISWVCLTSISFLSFNLLMLFALSGLFIFIISKKVENKLGLYFAIIFVIPGYLLQTPLLNLNYQKVVSLTILFPLFLAMKFTRKDQKPPRSMADVFLAVYLILLFALSFRGIYIKPGEGNILTYPACIKFGIDIFVDYFIPYYVASRYIKTFDQLKTALFALVTICIILAPLAVFEIGASKLLYLVLPGSLHTEWMIGEVFRSGMLRATTSIEHPLYLGMLMMIGLGLYVFVSNYIKNKFLMFVGLGIICAGLIAPLSKGPWTGTAVMFVMLYLFSTNKLKNGAIFIMLMSILTVIVLNSGQADRIISLLPFVGNVDSGNVDYREVLFQQSLIVIQDFPLFGMFDPTKHKAMLPLYQGEGIVDIVNLYLGVAMTSGLVGLFLYLSFLFTVTFSLIKELFIMEDKKSMEYKCGQSFIGILFGMYLLMVVVANAPVLNAILFALCGLIIGYINILKRARNKPFEAIESYSTTRVVK